MKTEKKAAIDKNFRHDKHFFLKIETYCIDFQLKVVKGNYGTPAEYFLMKGFIGEFEELVLLTIASFGNKAYGVLIKEDIEKRANRSISIGALHSTITRLEEKGYVNSWLGEPTEERGGRRKRYFELTQTGKVALHQMKNLRDELWKASVTNLKLAK